MESFSADQKRPVEGVSVPAAEDAGENSERPAKKQKKSLGSFFKIASRQWQAVPQSERESIEMELNSYLQAIEVNGETNPLEWWRQHEANFPRVANLAKKYLCIPALCIPVM
ncbi:zinc finger BED domain-containing protein 1-like, partial [Tachysurus ichikawai]